MIDVWQGDSILLEFPGGDRALIDTGEGGTGADSFDAPRVDILPYMKRNGIGKNGIKYLVLTHPHSDHIGGAATLLDKFDFKTVYDCGMPYTTDTYINLLKKIDTKKIKYMIPQTGQQLEWDPSVKIQTLHSGGSHFKEPNNNSIVLHVRFKDFSILLMGDAEKKVEEMLLTENAEIYSTILKAGHHGSATASSEEFLGQVLPKEILVSVGLNNIFGLPDSSIMERFIQKGARVWRTDVHGDVKIITDGQNYMIASEKVPFP